ncbi:TlpA family protein disulfide reductase [Skermania sp. ID1734]|uniref:TlpA family protein disulfide reductase n=1 Tax=Skermania sp. ID1734 TaxID=2597516 RepID=UPI00117DF0B4|nr:TlpA disulfide reductase family protein [Skermania sp. ID1734]TSE00593.1 TlpA family protein disulfide reductase [Skermania sp. ID1734]
MRISGSARWGLAALAIVIALIVALWPRAHDSGSPAAGPSSAAAAENPAELQQARTAAGLAPCPAASPTVASPRAALAGIRLTCLSDGHPVDLADALAGKPALLNLWAYWCAPCATELPHLQDYSDRAGNAITVLTVHTDPAMLPALARLTDLGVHLPGVEDGDKRVAAAVSAPAVLPVSVLIRADGSVAEVVARPFTSVDDIAATVQRALGVRS